MKFFVDKNSWLNFVIGLTGFYFVFSVMQIIMGKYGTKVVSAAPGGSQLSGDYYWLISFGIALILSLVLIILFCKPRVPFFVFLGILVGGTLGMYYTLYTTIIHLDKNVRKEGLIAVYDLLPHLIILAGALIALYFAWLSNRMSKSE